MAEVNSMFRPTRLIAYVGGALLAFILFILWPACMAAIKSMDLANFTGWVIVSMVWAFAAGAFLIIVPPIQEILSARKVKKRKDGEVNRQKPAVFMNEKPGSIETMF